MSLGTWNPDSKNRILKTSDINLKKYVPLGSEHGIEEAVANLSAEMVDELTSLMNQERTFWHQAANNLSTDEIICLVRFFALAEERHSQLYSGDNSPVIGLNQSLKKRHQSLPRELLLWIKSHSSNRFLPNGSIL